MTSRRWQLEADGEDAPEYGPSELAVRAELTKLGWVPGRSEGTKLGTLASEACLLAETLDHSQAVNTAIVNRELRDTMEAARTCSRGQEVEGTDEFTTRRRRRRRPGGPAEAAPEDPAAVPD